MTIEKGKSWGYEVEPGEQLPTAANDAELAAMASASLDGGSSLRARIAGGDLLATLGLSAGRGDGMEMAYPIDLGLAHLGDGTEGNEIVRPFVAHLTVRRLPGLAAMLGHGPGITVSVMNVAAIGNLRLGPKAHPNDGLIDVTEGRVPFRHRREAAQRAMSGSHLPHPDLRHRRVTEWQREFPRPVPIWLDGVSHGRFRTIKVELVPDGLVVVG